MPKISREGGPTYAGHEGVVRDARDEMYQINPDLSADVNQENGTVDENGQRREAGDPNTDSAKQAEKDAADKGRRDGPVAPDESKSTPTSRTTGKASGR